MAGWSMIAEGSDLECPKSPRKVEPSNFCVELDLELQSESTGTEFDTENAQEGNPDKLSCGFDRILCNFWEQTGDRNCFRSFPAMLGDGQCVDLYNLFVNVTQKGGYDAVSENGLWCSVVEDCGFEVNNVSSVKLLYIKYLAALERWVAETVEKKGLEGDYLSEELGWFYMELEGEFKDLLWRVSNQKKKNEEFQHSEEAPGELTFCDRDEKCFDDREFLGVELEKSTANSTGVGKLCDEYEAMSTVELDGDKECVDDGNFPNFHLTRTVVNLQDSGRLCNNGKGKGKDAVMDEDEKLEDHDENVVILNNVVAKEGISSGKRKRECMWELLNWVTEAAKNPCEPVIGSLRESSKWKSNVYEEFRKQVLLVRQAIFFKRVQHSSAEKSWQKNQKMHPCMYEDHIGSSYNLRERLGCGQEHLSGKLTSQYQACPESPSSGNQSDLDKSQTACMTGVEGQHDSSTPYSLFDDVPNKIPLGLSFQAEIPEWTGATFESDSKWLGTQFWPLVKEEHRFLIERDYIGKGRQDSCGCEVPGCVECVRFHSTEKRLRLKRELGSAFYHWKFDKMGEEVSLSWTREEEKRFKAIMRLNSPSVDTSFWDELFKFFPKRKREDLVSYYYNVFLLRRRGYQNRFTPNDIDSDDDESGSGLVTNTVGYAAVKSPNSILYSPNKKRTSFR